MKWNPEFPREVAEIDAVLKTLMTELGPDDLIPKTVEEHTDHRVVSLTPGMQKMLALQRQLFRAVFGREPGPKDPIFWDRNREHEGLFPVTEEEEAKMFGVVHEVRLEEARDEMVDSIGRLLEVHVDLLRGRKLPDPMAAKPALWALLNTLRDTCYGGLLVSHHLTGDGTEDSKALAIELMSESVQKACEEFCKGAEPIGDVQLPGTH